MTGQYLGLLTVLLLHAVESDAACKHPGYKSFGSLPFCYRVYAWDYDYDQAYKECAPVGYTGRLATFETPEKHKEAQEYLQTKLFGYAREKCTGFWMGLERKNKKDCSSQFFWKKQSKYSTYREPMIWNAFGPGEPNCANNSEGCALYSPASSFQWNDENCSKKMCFICEVESDDALINKVYS